MAGKGASDPLCCWPPADCPWKVWNGGKSAAWFFMRIFLGMLLCLLLMPMAWAKDVTLNFKNVDLRVLIEFVAEVTHKNFLIDNRVKGRVTIISRAPIPERNFVVSKIFTHTRNMKAQCCFLKERSPFPRRSTPSCISRRTSIPGSAIRLRRHNSLPANSKPCLSHRNGWYENVCHAGVRHSRMRDLAWILHE